MAATLTKSQINVLLAIKETGQPKEPSSNIGKVNQAKTISKLEELQYLVPSPKGAFILSNKAETFLSTLQKA